MGVAALLAFCSPYPVRFAIEGKGYALLVLLVALAWWWRQPAGAATAWPGSGGLHHFYGLFLFAVAASGMPASDAGGWPELGLPSDPPALDPGGVGLPTAQHRGWIGTPDFALLEDTLARGWDCGRCPSSACSCCCWRRSGAGDVSPSRAAAGE